MIKTFIEFLIMGILSGYLLIYGLRPSVSYPDFILEPFQHNWLFLIIFLINYYLFIFNIKIGFLMLLAVIALIFDFLIFAKKNNDYKKKIESIKIDHIHYISNLL